MSIRRLRLFLCALVPTILAATFGFCLARQEPGLGEPPSDLKSLHKDDIEAFAKRFEKSGRPEKVRDLRKRWLDTKRRETLDPRDADGRVALGDQYESLIDDKKTAATLYLESLAIDPNQQRAIDGLVRLGYRKVRNAWVAPETSRDSGDRPTIAAATTPADAGGLRGLTQAEVRRRMGGNPDRVVRAASQGRIIEQWIYRGARESQYIDFLAGGSLVRPIVQDQFTLPESADPGAGR